MGHRVSRVEREVQQIAASFLAKEYSGGNFLVTVTRVQLTPDLRSGIVYVTYLAPGLDPTSELDEDFIEELQGLAAEIQAKIASSIRMKYNPRLKFEYDTSQAKALQVESLIREVSDQTSGPVSEESDQ